MDWDAVFHNAIHLGIAYILALPIGWDQEMEARSAGIRTFPLVAVGSCGYVLIGLQVFSDDTAHARILYGLITGIGFIGGGAILKERGTIRGTATAASIWITGAIGAAVAWRLYDVAVVLSLMDVLTLKLGRPAKHWRKLERRESRSENESDTGNTPP